MQIWRFILRFLISFFAIFSILFLVANGPAFLKKLRYFVGKKPQTAFLPIANTVNIRKANKIDPPRLEKNSLFIPALDVKAPVLYSATVENSELEKLLKEGVVHLADTALPGTLGNSVIVGHSSSYAWDKSQKYGTIFATLDKLRERDLIWIKTEEGIFAYEVKNKIIVKPSAVEILNPTPDATLTLFTCYPVGTTKSRLVIQAKLFYPKEALPALGEKPAINTLPKIR